MVLKDGAADEHEAGGRTVRISMIDPLQRNGWPERTPQGGFTTEEWREMERGDFLTLPELCKELHFSYDWLWKKASKGVIKAWRPFGGQYRIPMSEVERMKTQGIKSARQVKQEARDKAVAEEAAASRASVLHIPVRLRKSGPKGAVLDPPKDPPQLASPPKEAPTSSPGPVTAPPTAEDPSAPAAEGPAKREGPRRGYLSYPFAALED
jgi:excisionase family DNA binding protein